MANHAHDRGAREVAARAPASDTIAAVATPPGIGGIGVVRISGPDVRQAAQALLGRVPRPRYASHTTFRGAAGEPIDHGIALFFAAPHSFTGEDVLELHAHGGPVVLDMLLKTVLACGARLAQPGEFSQRAFLNGKLDLAQAEAIADLIESSSETAARGALRSLEGKFSEEVHAVVDAMIRLRTYVEAAIDFPEEEIDFLADARIADELFSILTAIERLQGTARQGCLLHDGMTVVLAGPPNAGKSSLLNALAQQDSAIVSATPGTTRDVVRERVNIDGMPMHVLDTAGLRESADEIEGEGMRRARAAMERADRGGSRQGGALRRARAAPGPLAGWARRRRPAPHRADRPPRRRGPGRPPAAIQGCIGDREDRGSTT
ncbi:MAG: tRNA uridine-5-carboxymethylaminomethyl(34) synthesis GTPase MnmE, partial [Acidiferrobacterales bacterium]|nr:tRNA uridine-5-carboxymethylaminomethyl(34) synthesis GTPase MnmE [Acidiferrobacterales bacterium]